MQIRSHTQRAAPALKEVSRDTSKGVAGTSFSGSPDSIQLGQGPGELGLIPSRIAKPSSQKRLDNAVIEIREKYDLPALGAVMIKGDTILTSSDGVRNSGSAERIGSQDKFHLGSCTKMMTSAMIARLVEKGSLAWDTSVGDVFSKSGGSIHPALRDVTLADLASHQSGLPYHPTIRHYSPKLLHGLVEGESGWQEMVAEVLAKGPAQEKGTFLYSNIGYAVVGAIAETVTGLSYENLMQREVFEPLGMSSAGFGPTGQGQPQGHTGDMRAVHTSWPDWRSSDRSLPMPDNFEALGPAGTAHCSLPDWTKFAQAQMNRSPDYLNGESWSRLHSDRGQGYTVGGWGTDPAKPGELSHHGSNTYNYAVVTLRPPLDGSPGEAVLVATNVAGESGSAASVEMTKVLKEQFGSL